MLFKLRSQSRCLTEIITQVVWHCITNQWWLEIHISQNELDNDSVISLSGLTHDVFKAYEYKILALKH